MNINAGPNNVNIGIGGLGAPGSGVPTDGAPGGNTVFNGITKLGGPGGIGDNGGGGGSGAAGGPSGNNGGIGILSDIVVSGVFVSYGDGGGGARSSNPPSTGGNGNGGSGAVDGGASATNAVANTCSGGGGDWFGFAAGNGSDGKVVIKYKTDGSEHISPLSTGGIVTTDGLYTVHTFNVTGVFNCVTV